MHGFCSGGPWYLLFYFSSFPQTYELESVTLIVLQNVQLYLGSIFFDSMLGILIINCISVWSMNFLCSSLKYAVSYGTQKW